MSRDKKYAAEVGDELKSLYPDGECMLKYEGEPWRLLCMAILSAQCTDARVNLVSEGLFSAYPDVYAMADADDLEGEVPDLYTLAYERFIILLTAKEIAGVEVRQDDDLAPVLDIVAVDETAGEHLNAVKPLDIRIDSVQGDIEITLAVSHLEAALAEGS